MALRIEGWLGVENGGRADTWLAQQASFDLWKAREAGAPTVKRATLPSPPPPHDDTQPSERNKQVRNLACIACAILLFGCGLESAGTAATVGKLQADQAKQAKETLDKVTTNLDAAMAEAEQNRKKAEEATNN